MKHRETCAHRRNSALLGTYHDDEYSCPICSYEDDHRLKGIVIALMVAALVVALLVVWRLS